MPSDIKPRRRVSLYIFSGLLALTLFSWGASYLRYPILSHEAYAGVGTEFVSVRGCFVFYYFNSYHNGLPPQVWGFALVDPHSENGERMADDFDPSDAPGFFAGTGLFFVKSDTAFTGHTVVRLLSIPYWLVLLCILFTGAIVLWLKKPRKAAEA